MINPKTIALLKLSGFKPAAALRWEKGTTTIAVHESRFVVIYMHNPEGQRKQFHESTPDRINRDLQKFLKDKFGVEIPELTPAQKRAILLIKDGKGIQGISSPTLAVIARNGLLAIPFPSCDISIFTPKGAIIAEMLKADTNTTENH